MLTSCSYWQIPSYFGRPFRCLVLPRNLRHPIQSARLLQAVHSKYRLQPLEKAC
jgi:hypothetical protein